LISKFNDLASPMLDRVKANRLIIQTLSALRDTLLPRLISGKIRLPEAESIVSEAL
jgi:type I restriction enzyme S subunit